MTSALKSNMAMAIAALFALTACGTSQDLGRGKTGKSMVIQGGTYDQVWNAALAAVKQTGGDQKLEIEKNLTVSKEDKLNGEINATTGMSLLSWGEVVGVYVTPTYDAPQYTVEVESLSKLKTNLFANNWEDELLASIKRNITTPQAATPVYYAPQPAAPAPATPYAPTAQ